MSRIAGLICCFFSVTLFLFVFQSHVQAHGGEEQYIKINSFFVPENPIPGVVFPTRFSIGSESTSSAYVVGKEILFEIDEESFSDPYKAVNTIFQWDFSDGSKKIEGISVRHTYVKPGTYIIRIYARFPGKEEEFKQINTVQIDVVLDEKYVRPQAKIGVNGKNISGSKDELISITPGRVVRFDASGSTGNIKKYEWDFGDSSGATTSQATHVYSREEPFPAAVLRVTDEQNISSDALVTFDMPYTQLNMFTRFFYSVYDFITGSVLKL